MAGAMGPWPRLRPAVIILVTLMGAVAANDPAAAGAAAGSSALRRGAALRQPEEAQKAAAAAPAASAVVVLPTEVDTTTPPPASGVSVSPVSVLKSLGHEMYWQLHRSPYQSTNAAVAAVLGFIMVCDGEFVFKWSIVAGVFLVAHMLAVQDIGLRWDKDFKSPIMQVVGFEAGALCGYAAWKGFEGVQSFVGMVIGVVAAMKAQNFFVDSGMPILETNKWIVIAFYTMFILGLTMVFSKKGHLTCLAVISPAIGGALITSAVSFGLTKLALQGYLDVSATLKGHPVDGPWIDFLYLVWTTKSPDVGIFAGSPNYSVNLLGKSFCMDRVAGWSFWFVLFTVGAVIQCRRDKTRRAVAAALNEELREGLLEKKS